MTDLSFTINLSVNLLIGGQNFVIVQPPTHGGTGPQINVPISPVNGVVQNISQTYYPADFPTTFDAICQGIRESFQTSNPAVLGTASSTNTARFYEFSMNITSSRTQKFRSLAVLPYQGNPGVSIVGTGNILSDGLASTYADTNVGFVATVLQVIPSIAPPCRLYPRDDALGSGSGRLWPPPSTRQAGRHTGPL